MRIAIHAHPQFSYLTRSILELAKLKQLHISDIEVVLMVCPNFIPHFNSSLVSYLENTNIFSLLKSFQIIRIDLVDSQYYLSSLYGCDPYILSSWSLVSKKLDFSFPNSRGELLLNSVMDSCFRNLLDGIDAFKFYTQPSSTYASNAVSSRLSFSLALIDTLAKYLRTIKADYFVLSHANYDFYVAAMLAAERESTAVYIVNGGFHQSYEVFPEAESDPCSEGVVIDVCEGSEEFVDQALNYSLPSVFNSYQLNESKRTPSSSNTQDIARSLESSLLNKHSTSSSILVYLPIFSEVNHHHALRPRSCANRFEWLFKIVDYASRHNINTLVIKRHPDESFYQETTLVNSLLRYCIETSSFTGRLITIAKASQLEEFMHMQRLSSVTTVPVAYSGSIVAESISRGISVIPGNYCLGTCNSPFRILSDCTVAIEDRLDFAFSNPQSLLDVDKIAQRKITKVLKLFSSIGKYHSPDRLFRLASDKFYFFGRILSTSPSTYSTHVNNYLKLNISSFKMRSASLTIWN